MSIRGDITVDFTVSPRIITVAAPSTEITIQDLHDTLRSIEALPASMDDTPLITTGGKENLGGGVEVGLTSTLLNAVLAFEARPGPDWVLCRISGGNLVALDANDNDIDPRYPTAFVTVDRASSSSATTQGIEEIQFLIFEGAVNFDAAHGSAGTVYPVGSTIEPVNNIPDALIIAANRGLSTLKVSGDVTILDTDLPAYSEGAIIGFSHTASHAIISGVVFTESTFEEMIVSGAFGSGSYVEFKNCVLDGLSGLVYDVQDSTLKGTLTFDNVDTTNYFVNCITADIDGAETIIDFSGTVGHLVMQDFHGKIRLMNMDNAARGVSTINMSSGKVIIDPSCTEGTIKIRGVGEVDDLSTGNMVVDNDVIDVKTINVIKKLLDNKAVISPDDLTVTIYDDDKVTPIRVYDISADKRIRTPQ